ncbi:peptidoglycan-binding protein [Streptomyces sp. NPDC058964]|uniref:peptidoglycan-binding domain-containing protein n=1 Tax=Streptomyces sp. NPDC058964 TaxID=3346681 RepID=UPI00367DA411
MTEPKNHQCPGCGTPRGTDNTPSCDCTQRASDALRDARTAQAAAAEDFDPLRIRPYVELAGATGKAAGQGPDPDPAPDEGVTQPIPAAEVTMPLRPVSGPSTTDLRMFEPGRAEAAEEDRAPRRSRRALLLSVSGAALAVVAAAGFASGLFSYEAPARDRAAAREVRESVPEETAGTSSEPASTAAAPGHPTSSPSSPSLSAPRPTSASPSPTASSSRSGTTPSPRPSRSATPTQTATATGAEDLPRPTSPPVLRRGDHGPEVTELQLRLTQLNLYVGEASGIYNRQVEDAVSTYQLARGIRSDEPGVYGAATRARLESETSQP